MNSTVKVNATNVSPTEISRLATVTSGIQGQLNAIAPAADPTFTGTATGVSKCRVGLGLGNCDSTSDASKPVSTTQQTALDLKANLASPTFSGNPTAPTQSLHDNSTRLYTTAFFLSAIANLVNSPPESMNTLSELSSAIEENETAIDAIIAVVGGKRPLQTRLSPGT